MTCGFSRRTGKGIASSLAKLDIGLSVPETSTTHRAPFSFKARIATPGVKHQKLSVGPGLADPPGNAFPRPAPVSGAPMRTRNASICPLLRTANAFSRASATSVSRNEDGRDLNAPPPLAASPANNKGASRITPVSNRALLVFEAPSPSPPPSPPRTAIVGSSVIRRLASMSKKYAQGFTSSLAAPATALGTPSSSLAIFDSNASKMPRSCLYSRA